MLFLPSFIDLPESMLAWSTYGVAHTGCTGEGKPVEGNFRQYLILEECKKSCDNSTSKCNAIAWNSRDNRCYLKNKEDACVDRSCYWDRNDASEWTYYWKTCSKI